MKPDSSGVVHATANCKECDFSAASLNSVGLAAQHAERTGHAVHAEQCVSMSWNLPDPDEEDDG